MKKCRFLVILCFSLLASSPESECRTIVTTPAANWWDFGGRHHQSSWSPKSGSLGWKLRVHLQKVQPRSKTTCHAGTIVTIVYYCIDMTTGLLMFSWGSNTSTAYTVDKQQTKMLLGACDKGLARLEERLCWWEAEKQKVLGASWSHCCLNGFFIGWHTVS